MTEDAKLSVVIPVYNRASLVERTLDSVASQTLRPLEVIIVDNNSTDDTLPVVHRWMEEHSHDSDLHVQCISELRPGAAVARNAGLAIVKTRYVMFFDSDDEMSPTLTADIVEAFEAKPSTDIVAWPILTQLVNGTFRLTRPFSIKYPLSTHIIHATLSTQRYAAGTDFVREAGGWDESVRAWMDLELGVRLLARRPHVTFLDVSPQVKTYYTQQSITATNPTSIENHRLEHTLDRCEADLVKAGRHDAVKWINVRRAILAAEYSRGGNRQAARRLMRQLPAGWKMVYTFLYLKHRLFRRGTHLLVPFARC